MLCPFTFKDTLMSYTALRVVKNVIEQLSEQLIISRFRNDFGAYDLDTGVPALRFHICISADNLGYDVNGVHHKKWANQERIYVTVIVTGNHKVFIAKTDCFNVSDVKPTDFKNTSNHNSCWKSDGLSDLHSMFSEVSDKYFINVPKEERASLQNGTEVFFGLSIGQYKLFDFVHVKYIDEDDSDTYWKKLTEITKSDATITFETK